MNSINNVEFLKNLVEEKYNVRKTEIIDQYQMAFEVYKEDVHRLLVELKQEGWKQLSYLSAIDWLEEGEFELVYILFNWDRPVHIQIRTRLDRENPLMNSVLPIFPGCKYYEREAHEFFGIKFPGNPDHEKQLVLEEWDDMPPLRKDFDPQAYSDRKFPVRKYSNDFIDLNGEESKKEKREKRYSRILQVGKRGRKK